MVTEKLLHYIWQTLRFDFQNLKSNDGTPITIHSPGRINRNQGPDFLHAVITIGEQKLFGDVEIHINSEDWYVHGHHQDPIYNNTILHVVLRRGKRLIECADGSIVPELCLEGRIANDLLTDYNVLMELNDKAFPCQDSITQVHPFIRRQWLESLAWSRLVRKANSYQTELTYLRTNWEQLVWFAVAGAMGGSINREAFEALAVNLPIHILRKYDNNSVVVEALIFGVAGYLSEPSDKYAQQLAVEWQFYAHKHNLAVLKAGTFKTHRLRPPNFPSVRISQLAALVKEIPHFVSLIDNSITVIDRLTSVPLSNYWQNHYNFGKPVALKQKGISKSQAELLYINALAPLTILYLQNHNQHEDIHLVAEQLNRIPAENNSIINPYKTAFELNSALATQAVLELAKFYCAEKRCIECTIGRTLLKKPLNSLKTAFQ